MFVDTIASGVRTIPTLVPSIVPIRRYHLDNVVADRPVR